MATVVQGDIHQHVDPRQRARSSCLQHGEKQQAGKGRRQYALVRKLQRVDKRTERRNIIIHRNKRLPRRRFFQAATAGDRQADRR